MVFDSKTSILYFCQMDNGLPNNIKMFLTDCIENVSQLELLFVMFENQMTNWSAEAISKTLRTHISMALKQMEILSSKGILKKNSESTFSYAPQTDVLNDTISQLFELYQVKPVSIVTYIFTKPEDKLKGFANVFKFKKD